MKKCKHCGQIVSDDDKICSRCGENLLDNANVETATITDAINDHEKSDDYIPYVEVKYHKKIVAFLLAFFLGPLGIHFYYLGFILYGILWPLFHVILIVVAMLVGINPGIVVIIMLIVNMTVAIAYLCKKDVVDKNGNDLL